MFYSIFPVFHAIYPPCCFRYAGNALATVKSSEKVKLLSVRTTAFEKVAETGGSATVDTFEVRVPESDAGRNKKKQNSDRFKFG